MRAPDGIGDWTQKRFRQWTGSRIENHTDQLDRLLKIVSQQNAIISQLRRNQEILTSRVDLLTRPGSTDFAIRLAEMAGDNEL
ncbi:MAG: hypothetical protein IH943_07165 [Acidobacteria bacterium]|nr:hypothetical protein [Acidobacteriota bacterium]